MDDDSVDDSNDDSIDETVVRSGDVGAVVCIFDPLYFCYGASHFAVTDQENYDNVQPVLDHRHAARHAVL